MEEQIGLHLTMENYQKDVHSDYCQMVGILDGALNLDQ